MAIGIVARRSRLVTLFSYLLVIVIYTVAIVYIFRCHDDQNLKDIKGEPLTSFKSNSPKLGDGTANNALRDGIRLILESNSSLVNNSRYNYDGYDDDYDHQIGGTSKEFIRQPTHAVKNNQPSTKGTRPTPKGVRLLCWVLTDPGILDKAAYARDTWMQACDIRLFMSSEENKTFPAVGLNVSSGRNHIAEKSKAAWTYVYENHRNDADYFMKADPDSYIVVGNLKRYLANCDPDEPAIYGHNLFYIYTSEHYVAGEAVVLGRESIHRLVTKGLRKSDCFRPGQAEDLKTCQCLAKVGGYTVDTRDESGRETFLPPFAVEHIVTGNLPRWYVDKYRQPYGYCQSIDCLSHHPIAFHYVSRQQFYLMNYLFSLQSNASDDHEQFRFNGTRF